MYLHSIFSLMLLVGANMALGQTEVDSSETGNHGDPYFKKWRRAKQELSYRLKSTKFEDLWAMTPSNVLEWLANFDQPDEPDRIVKLGEALETRGLEITKPGIGRPAEKCLTINAIKFVVNGTACGNLAENAMQGLLLEEIIKEYTLEENDVFRTSIFLAIALAYHPTLKSTPTHSDQWKLRWYRSRLLIAAYLNKHGHSSALAPSTTRAAIEWLKVEDVNRFQQIASDLLNSSLIFLGEGIPNSEGTCAQTSQTANADIVISKHDCGTDITDLQIMETLVGDTTHHFQKDDDFADAVGMSIVDAYDNFMTYAAPFFGATFSEVYGANRVSINFSFSQSYEHFRIFALTHFFGNRHWYTLELREGSYTASGKIGSFTCTYEGIGRNESGGLEYGVLSRNSIKLDGSIKITVRPDGRSLQVELMHEVHDDSCGVSEKKTKHILRHALPSREQLLENRSTRFRNELNVGNIEAIRSYIKKGHMTASDTSLLWQKFLTTPGLASLTDLMQDEAMTRRIPGSAIYDIFLSHDRAHAVSLLESNAITSRLNFSSQLDGQLPLGYLFSRNFRTQFASFENYEDFVAAVLPFFIVKADDLTKPASSIKYHDIDALFTALLSRPSVRLVNMILEKYPLDRMDLANQYGRKVFDYLYFYWMGFTGECGKVVERSPANSKIRHEFAERLAALNEIRAILTQRGAKPERTGCIYFQTRICREVNGKLELETYGNFETVVPPYGSRQCG